MKTLPQCLGIVKGTPIRDYCKRLDAQINPKWLARCGCWLCYFLMHTNRDVPPTSFLADRGRADLLVHGKVAVVFEPEQAHAWQLDSIGVDMDRAGEGS